ncbi:YraN family protein [Candidatus Azambacteria bacterium]|nr:YraN family protein [Candidatus Azambacteria bacterium]
MPNATIRKILGEVGEKAAAAYLETYGFEILAKNWKIKLGELDIVVKKDGVFHFVEVKTQPHREAFRPEDLFDFKKRRKLKRLAQAYLISRRIPLDSHWQIDLIAVELDGWGNVKEIRHLPQVT